MAAVITIRQAQINTFIEAHIHSPMNQGLNRFYIIIDGIFYILNLTAIGQIPKTILQILLLNRGNILCYMAVEAVAYIFPIGNPFNYPVFLSELLYLQTAEVLCRSTVDGVEISVYFLLFICSSTSMAKFPSSTSDLPL